MVAMPTTDHPVDVAGELWFIVILIVILIVGTVGLVFIITEATRSKKIPIKTQTPEDWKLPSYIDDVCVFAYSTDFPSQGVLGKVYIDTSQNECYRWERNRYVQMVSTVPIDAGACSLDEARYMVIADSGMGCSTYYYRYHHKAAAMYNELNKGLQVNPVNYDVRVTFVEIHEKQHHCFDQTNAEIPDDIANK